MADVSHTAVQSSHTTQAASVAIQQCSHAIPGQPAAVSVSVCPCECMLFNSCLSPGDYYIKSEGLENCLKTTAHLPSTADRPDTGL